MRRTHHRALSKEVPGIKRMRDAMKNENLPPPKIGMDSFFFITLKRLQVGEASATGEVGHGKTTRKATGETREKTREKIIEILRRRPEITTAELSMELGISQKGVEWQITKMKKENIIRRIGPDKGGQWEVLE